MTWQLFLPRMPACPREAAQAKLSLDDDGDPVPLTLPSLDPHELTHSISEFGELAVATTAALLLSGPVSIIGAGASTLEERLRFIDAVAALLPYGCRTGYSAATWSR